MPLPSPTLVPRARSAGYAARLDDLLLRVAPAPSRVLEQSFDRLQAGRVDTAVNAEEIVVEFGQVFARSDFTGGQGLDRAHRRGLPDSAASRYWSSAGVDVVASRGGFPAHLRLLHAAEWVYTAFSLASPAAFDAKLFARTAQDPQLLAEISSPTATVAVTTTDPHSGEATSATTVVTDPAALGDYLYVGAGTNGVHRRTRGTTTWAHYSDVRLDRLWSVKNRLIGSYQGTLYEVRAGAASVTLHTLGSGTAGRWDVVADAGQAILAAGSTTGTGTSVLHAFTPDDTGALVIAAQQSQPEREMIADLVTSYGRVIFATVPDVTSDAAGKLWAAELGEGSTLADVTLLADFSSDLDARFSGRKLTLAGTDVYIGAVEVVEPSDEPAGQDEEPNVESLQPHLWRLDLITLGLHRHAAFSSAGVEPDPAFPPWPYYAYGRLFMADAGGLHRVDDDTYVPEGYLISPLADFSSISPKEWVSATLATEPVASGTEVELYYSTDPAAIFDADHPSWKRVKRITSGVDDHDSPLGAEGRELAAMVKLISSSVTATPRVRGFSFRGFLGGSDLLIALPVDVSDLLDRPGKAATRSRGRGRAIYNALLERQGDDGVLELFDLGLTMRGVVEGVDTPISTRTTRGSQTLHCTLRFRGRSVSGSAATLPPAEGALGRSTLGLPPPLGVTE